MACRYNDRYRSCSGCRGLPLTYARLARRTNAALGIGDVPNRSNVLTRDRPGYLDRDRLLVRGPGGCLVNGTTFSPSGTGKISRTFIVLYRRRILPSCASEGLDDATRAATSSLRLVLSPASLACSTSLSSQASTGRGQETAAGLSGFSTTRLSASSEVSPALIIGVT